VKTNIQIKNKLNPELLEISSIQSNHQQASLHSIEGYIQEVNNMKGSVAEIIDSGIEILPAILTVGEGIDELGRIMIVGIQAWVEWIPVVEETLSREIKE
jgi:hypothetical protein